MADENGHYFGSNVDSTTPLGRYPGGRTPEGVEDMAGNVLEWCADWYGDYGTEPQTDPRGPRRGRYRVLRGGSFGNPPVYLRAAGRYHDEPENRHDNVGFRVVWLSPQDR